jgi:hypothetical protein
MVETLTGRAVSWDDAAAEHFAAVPMAEGTIDDLELLSVSGAGQVVAIETAEAERIASVLLQVQPGRNGPELCVVAAAGRRPGLSLMASILPAVEEIARSAECVAVTAKSIRGGAVKAMRRLGFEISEVSLRKAL